MYTQACAHAARTMIAKGLPRVDRLTPLLPWLLPTHSPILDPNQWIGAAPLTAGSLALSFVSNGGDFSGHGLRLTVTGAVTAAAIHIRIPEARLNYTRRAANRVAGAIHHRLKTDWSKITTLKIGITSGPSGADRWEAGLVVDGKSMYGCTDPTYASAWNGKWRTIPRASAGYTKVGTPAPWGTEARYIKPYGVWVEITTTDSVTLDIDRLYSVDWPATPVVSIMDGWNRTAAEMVIAEFIPRGWGAGGSMSQLENNAGSLMDYEMRALTGAGYDVYPHSARVYANGDRLGMEPTDTELDLLHSLSSLRSGITTIGGTSDMMRFNQWLQNSGTYNGTDMAGVLRRQGVAVSRHWTSDAEWGVDPFNAVTHERPARTGYNTAVPVATLPYEGRFNVPTFVPGGNQPLGTKNYLDNNRPNPPGMIFSERLDYAAMSGNALVYYHHLIVDNPPTNSVTPEWHRDSLAHFDEHAKAGRTVMIGPGDFCRLMWLRPGDIHLASDGEWRYRHDPTRIAF